jgi:hypothetical protein
VANDDDGDRSKRGSKYAERLREQRHGAGEKIHGSTSAREKIGRRTPPADPGKAADYFTAKASSINF